MVISMDWKSLGSAELVMAKVPLPPDGTTNVPADTAWRPSRLTYQHSYHRFGPTVLRWRTVRVIFQLPEVSCWAVAEPEAGRPGPWGGTSWKAKLAFGAPPRLGTTSRTAIIAAATALAMVNRPGRLRQRGKRMTLAMPPGWVLARGP